MKVGEERIESETADRKILGKEAEARLLEVGITLLVAALYALLLTGDYFVGWSPIRGRSLTAVLVFLIAATAVVRLSLQYRLVMVLRPQAHLIGLALIVVVGLLVRIYPLGFGLPVSSPPDEAAIMQAAWRVLTTGDYNLHSSTLPSLYVYFQAGAFVLRFLEGVWAGLYSRLEAAQVADFYSWARLLTAVFGGGTVYLVYLIGRRFYGRSIGLLSAFLLAFSFIHAQYSRIISPDVPAAFLATAALLCLGVIFSSDSLSPSRRKTLFAASGVTFGLATAVRYSMIVGVLVLVLAYLLNDNSADRRRLDLTLGLAGFVAGFLSGAPFALLDLPAFLNGLAVLAQTHGFQGVLGLPPREPWRQIASYFLRIEFGVLVAALVGLSITVVKHRRNDWLLLSFPVLFFTLASSYQGDFVHILVPLTPFAAILAARAIDWAVGGKSRLILRLARVLGPGTAAIPWITAAALVGVSLLH